MNDRISIIPTVCHGKPVIKGTRVLVGNLLGALSSGDTIDDILKDYQNISKEDVFAALDFAGQLISGKAYLLRDHTCTVFPID